jgi:L-ribulose-5-phosphate 4-epimerase
VIVETFRERGLSPQEIPAVLVRHHGPFTWGETAAKAVENARVLEYVARMDLHARLLSPAAPRPGRHLVDRHFLRKHGGAAYYGQKK